jgi:hypothetical protein
MYLTTHFSNDPFFVGGHTVEEAVRATRDG